MRLLNKHAEKILRLYPQQYYDLTQHCSQVAKLALLLFKGTKELHKLNKKSKKYLLYSSLLHDIGYVRDAVTHNKCSRDIIMATHLPNCTKKEQKIIACIARYHRGAFPNPKHKIYRELKKSEQNIVNILASLLRVADGLDYTHQNTVKTLKVKVKKDRSVVTIEVYPEKMANPTIDIERAKKKSTLFSETLKIPSVTIHLHTT